MSYLSASAADISRNFGDWQSKAMTGPVTITHHGRPRLVLASIDLFKEMSLPPASESGQAEFSHTNAQLRAVLNQMRDGFMALDSDLKMVDVNPAAELYLGISRDECLGRDVRDINPEVVDSIALDFYKRVLRTREPVEFKVKFAWRDRPYVNMQVFPYDDGGVAVIFANLASREEADILRAQVNATAAALHGHPGLSMIRLNLRGGFEVVDDAFCEMVGFPRSQLSGLLLSDIVHLRDRLVLAHVLNDCIRDQSTRVAIVTLMPRDGRDQQFRLSMSICLHEGAPAGVVVCVVDIAKLSERDGYCASRHCD
jgi:prevent-host-death family protein